MGHIHCFLVSRLISASVSEGLDFFVWGGEVRLREFCCCLCQSVCSLVSAMPTCVGTHWSTTLLLFDRVHKLLSSCWVRRPVGPFVRDWRAGQYSADCSLPQSGVLWQLSGHVLLLCSWSSGHQLEWRGRRLFHLGDGCRHHCVHS